MTTKRQSSRAAAAPRSGKGSGSKRGALAASGTAVPTAKIRKFYPNETPEDRMRILAQTTINGVCLAEAFQPRMIGLNDMQVPDGTRIIVYSDDHLPANDAKVENAELKMADMIQPHYAVHLGDEAEESEMSRWPPNPYAPPYYAPARGPRESETALVKKATRGNPLHFFNIKGNHWREGHYLQNAPLYARLVNPLTGNPVTDGQDQLNIRPSERMSFIWGRGKKGGEEGGLVINGDVRIRHGKILKQFAPMSAFAHWLKDLVSTVMGHQHATGDVAAEHGIKTMIGMVIGNAVNWQTPSFDYSSGQFDWLHAFAVLFVQEGIVFGQIVPILGGYDEKGIFAEYFLWLDQDGNTVLYRCDD
jgi:hypothetical protein